MTRTCIVAGAVLGGLAVAAGAFGAHALRESLEAARQTANWDTATRYALAHAVVMVLVGCLAGLPQASQARGGLAASAWCLALGTLVFSGCLGALALTGVRVLGAVVPVGGALLIAGWAALAVAGMRFAR